MRLSPGKTKLLAPKKNLSAPKKNLSKRRARLLWGLGFDPFPEDFCVTNDEKSRQLLKLTFRGPYVAQFSEDSPSGCFPFFSEHFPISA